MFLGWLPVGRGLWGSEGAAGSHLESALQGPHHVHLLVDVGVLVASDEGLAALLLCQEPLPPDEGHPTLLQAPHQALKILPGGVWVKREGTVAGRQPQNPMGLPPRVTLLREHPETLRGSHSNTSQLRLTPPSAHPHTYAKGWP